MFVKRVNEDQEETQDGVEEEELLIWYLEQKESELYTQEDMEAERALAKKVLKKVVKVRCGRKSGVEWMLTCARNNTLCSFAVRVLRTTRDRVSQLGRRSTFCIRIVRLRILREAWRAKV
jgi:hypothetical protein